MGTLCIPSIPNAYFYYGNVSSCLKTLHHGLARLEQTDDYPEKARVLATKYGFLCDVLLEMDQLEDALSALDKSNAYLELCDFRLIRHNNKIRLADLWARTGRQQAALDLYRATIALAEEHYVPGLFYLSGARILRANGEFKQALELVEQTLKQTKDPPAKADLYLEKGTILALMGSQVFSQKAFRSARDIYRKHGMLQRWRSLTRNSVFPFSVFARESTELESSLIGLTFLKCRGCGVRRLKFHRYGCIS
jgi:tetratricopeptide (TPR) repeat protein